jgi:phenylpyruvate tautomerase PptA (4-oxalocrotonate tautomerase family)
MPYANHREHEGEWFLPEASYANGPNPILQGRTADQKRKIAKRITDALVEEAGAVAKA